MVLYYPKSLKDMGTMVLAFKKKCFNFKKDKFVTFLKVLGNFVITIVRGYMYIYITFMDVLWHISCSKGARVTQ